jgi:hypothetical protein
VRLRDHREPQRVRHALAVRLAVGREREHRLDQRLELERRPDLADERDRFVACVPEAVRRAGRDREELARPERVLSRPAFSPSVPDLIAKRSLWDGCTCAAATQPSGWTTVSITTASPSVSAEVARKVMRSPVTGLWMVSPVRIILWPPSGAV